jgi:hypothetical protein
MTLIDRLDAAAGKTGIPGLATSPLRRRRFRWLPILALLLGFGGYGTVLTEPGLAVWALTAVVAADMISFWMPMIGPLKVYGNEMADEYDRVAAMKSYLIGLGCVSFFAFVALMLLGGLTLLQGWSRETLLSAIIATAVMMHVILSTVPTLHASWAIRPLDEED